MFQLTSPSNCDGQTTTTWSAMSATHCYCNNSLQKENSFRCNHSTMISCGSCQHPMHKKKPDSSVRPCQGTPKTLC